MNSVCRMARGELICFDLMIVFFAKFGGIACNVFNGEDKLFCHKRNASRKMNVVE